MKLVFVGPGIMPIPPKGWGAVEILIWDMVTELKKQGHEVHIINTQNMKAAESEIKSLAPDFVHIQYDDYAELAGKVAKYAKAVAITSHFGYIEQINRWDGYRNVFNRCLNMKNENIYHFALSEGIANIYKKFGVKDSNIRIVPNGANQSVFRYTETPQHPERSLCLGKVERRKGQYLLQNIDTVWFAGNRADNTFNYSNPRYMGEWNKDTLYNSLTDYGNLILLSDGEADPLVVKEALVCGLGVVISKCASANLDLSKEFITIIPDNKVTDIAYIKNAIETNRNYSVTHREEIREYSKRFYWENLMSNYIKMVKEIMPVDSSELIGAIYPCYKKADIVYKVIRRFRQKYPNTDVVMINDGGDDLSEIAKEFNCKYIHYTENNKLVFTEKSKFVEVIERWREAVSQIKEPFFLRLEDDVYVNNVTNVKDLKNTINGFVINTLPKYDTDFINEYTKKNVSKYFYSFHGGSIVNTKEFLEVLSNDTILDLVPATKLGEYCHQGIRYKNKIVADDMLFSSLVYLNNKTIGPYPGHYEFSMQKIDINNPRVEVVHKYPLS